MSDTDLERHAGAFLVFANQILTALGEADRDLAAELRRSARAIGPNLARAAAIEDHIVKARTLGAARGKAMRCGAILTIARKTGSIDDGTCRAGLVVLERLVPAITRALGGSGKPGAGAECDTMLRWTRDPR